MSSSIGEFIGNNLDLIISIGLPVLIFQIQLWLWMKDHKTTSITFIENRSCVLDPSLSNRVDGLSILYHGEPINGYLLYYQITVTNSGTKDISNSEVANPLTISLPANIHVKSCEVFDKSEHLDVKMTIDANEIIVEWDMFKKDEYVRLDIVADYSPSEEYMYNKQSLLSQITYNKSRIQDLQVQKSNIRQYEYLLRYMKTIVYIVLSFFFIFSIFNQYQKVKEFSYLLNNEEQCSQLDFKEDSVYVADESVIEYPIHILGVHEVVVKRTDTHLLMYGVILMCVLGFILLEQLRMRRKRERYGLVSGKPWNQFELEDC